MTTVIDKVKNLIDIRLGSYKTDHSTIDQAMIDCAVILMSHMRPEEIETALYMSLGNAGVNDLLQLRLQSLLKSRLMALAGDENDGNSTKTDDSKPLKIS